VAERRLDQRLVAILAADVAGYSRLMEADERATVVNLDACRNVFHKHTEAFAGRIVDTAGDSVLAVFPSAIGAVDAAVAIQIELRTRNETQPDDQHMVFRIGVNLGDVIEKDDGSVYGSGVNVAARLESLAEPGGIRLSGNAREQVEGKLELVFEDCGEHEVKNIARPVRAYRVIYDEQAVPQASGRADSRATRPSIAVLAFENFSGDPDQEYVADGIAEDLITELSRLRWLQVTARNSTFTYKGTPVDVKQIGRDLGVRYVVEGSVRRGGKRIRITAQLIDASTGNHIWAERYDRDLSDIFALQDEITETLVSTLQEEVGDFERERARRTPPDNLDAWDAYQRGLWHLWQVDAENLTEAQRLFNSAIKLDPDFAQAHAAMAFSYLVGAQNNAIASPTHSLERALRFAKTAVALDDKDAMAHASMGRIYSFKGDFEAAVEESNIAIELSPSLALAHYGLGVALWFRDESPDAIPALDTAIRLSPRDPYIMATFHMRAFVRMCLGEYDQAVEDAQRATRLSTAAVWPFATLAAIQALMGRAEDAKQSIERLLEIRPNFSPESTIAAYFPTCFEAMRPKYTTWFQGLRKAGLDTPEEPAAAD
jgi:adenylate cyclase